jgi:hypothetical protein
MEENLTLKNVADEYGISYIATQHLYNYSAINETLILEDLRNGLLYEWLTFIEKHTDSNINNFQEALIKLFLEIGTK